MFAFGAVMRAPLIAAAVVALGTSGESIRLDYPPTRTVDASSTYFGTKVRDPYRWLENQDDPEVKAWSSAQTQLALEYVEKTKSFSGLKARIAMLDRSAEYRYGLVVRGGHVFYERDTPPEAHPDLVVLDRLGGTERILYSPSSQSTGGIEASIETFAVSADGSKVAFTTELGGSEDEILHIVDVRTGSLLSDTLSHIGSGATSPVAIAWDRDGRGFLHTQWPKNADGSYATSGIQIYHHVVGTDSSTDTYVFGKGLPPKSEFFLATSADGSAQAAVVKDGEGVHASVYLRRKGEAFGLVATPDAGISSSVNYEEPTLVGAFVGDAFYAIARKRDPRGEIVALRPGGNFDTAKVIVPASTADITDVVPVAGGFITEDVVGGDSAARLFEAGGTLRSDVPIPDVSTADVAGDPLGGPIVVDDTSYTTRSTWLAYDVETNTVRDVGFPSTNSIDFSNIVVERALVPSLDGTVKIPLEIVHARNVPRDGGAPTILYAYGAYGEIIAPSFSPTRLAWLERGGVYAQAMVRGGGEYGDAWHDVARLGTKTVSSDDLAACAMWLGRNGFGGKDHLGILGASAGGFLMGLALTRNPGLYRAVVAQVGVFDLLRLELTTSGAYNTPEFGTVKDPAQFAYMLAESPYHNVRKGTAYPAVLLMSGENDPRVETYHSRKMVAELQAATASGRPVLLLQRSGEGHTFTSDDQFVQNKSDIYAFFDRELR